MALRNDRTPVYFPGLGALRFLAAAIVFFSHIELFRRRAGLEHHYDHIFVSEAGRLAVSFFFVLSGFLITFLLLKERASAGAIHIGKFYWRRVLRIWPMYFVVLALAFFVFPQLVSAAGLRETEMPAAHFPGNLLLFVFLLPNLALSIWPPVALAEPLWSIGVEEQFYLIWPWLVKLLRKSLPFVLVFLLIFIPLLRCWLGYQCSQTADPVLYRKWSVAFSFIYYSRIECMAAGALAAWCLFEQKALRILFHPLMQALAAAGLIVLLVIMKAPVYQHLPFAGCFAILMLNIAANPKSLLRLNFVAGDRLGNCSYAFYLLHEIVILSCLWLFRNVIGADLNDGAGEILFTLTAFGLTLLLSWIAYRFFEKLFLDRKKKWQVVPSGSQQ
ncbi:MAG: acyltransferase 3 [Bacteroidetes bacterium]|nr:MAG: acyltransferase 3 [Bacteroidota bacterium]